MSSTHHNSQTTRQVTKAELPISCPTEDQASWNLHPRVFLALSEDNRHETCPYCSAQFVLIDSKA